MADTKSTKWEYNEKRNAIVSPSESNGDTNDDDYYGGKLICESVWDKDNAKVIIAAPEIIKELQDEVDFLQDLIDDEINIPVTARYTMRHRIIELKKTIQKATE